MIRSLIFLLLLLSHSVVWALSIQHVSHTPKNIIESSNGVSVRFYLDAPASVALKIYDDREYLIRLIESSGVLKQGDNKLHWDGKDAFGKNVPAEAYHYTIEASAANETVIYDVTDLLSTNKNMIRNLQWDREKGTISYLLVDDSRINIRAGIAGGGPLLTTVLNWLPRERGKHVEKWDGYDKNNKFNISKIPRADIFTDAYTFSANTIIVGKNISRSQYVEKPASSEARKAKTNSKVILDQARKKADDRADYQLLIQLPETKNFKNDAPVYKGKIPVKLNISKDDLQRMSRDRFEPILFVDGEYVSEIESGFFPVTWHLDTTQFESGEHYITINVRGYDGQYGTVSQNIYIQN